ncbi:MAG: dUTP pyrophosphatase [Ruminococcus sp.]|nr:dUTP pyrophosphatase [Ruminococcus sp.]
MHTTIKFAKSKPNAVIPTKREEDAGFDIYPCFEENYIRIKPHETKMIPTGIASACDSDYCFVLKERGSTGTKGIAQRCGVIDSGYRGEWLVPITNATNHDIVIVKKSIEFNMTGDTIIYPYENAICQALVVPVPTIDVQEYTYDELKNINSYRGNNAWGSTGK